MYHGSRHYSALVLHMLLHMQLQRRTLRRLVGAHAAFVRLFTRMDAEMLVQGILGGRLVRAKGTVERLLSRVRSDMFGHVVLPNGCMLAIGTFDFLDFLCSLGILGSLNSAYQSAAMVHLQ